MIMHLNSVVSTRQLSADIEVHFWPVRSPWSCPMECGSSQCTRRNKSRGEWHRVLLPYRQVTAPIYETAQSSICRCFSLTVSSRYVSVCARRQFHCYVLNIWFDWFKLTPSISIYVTSRNQASCSLHDHFIETDHMQHNLIDHRCRQIVLSDNT